MDILRKPVLVTTSGLQPYEITSVEEAMVRLVSEKAIYVLEDNNFQIRSQYQSFALPKIISSLTYHVLPKLEVRFSRLNVLYRDDLTCQYCGQRFTIKELTIDHIIPQSMWRRNPIKVNYKMNSFENCVAACKLCNTRKREWSSKKFFESWDKKLIRKPFVPKYMPHLNIQQSFAIKEGWYDIVVGQPSVRLIA